MDDRLKLIIRLLDSSVAGERSAAFARADALIARDGLLWSDVLKEIFADKARPMILSGVEFGHSEICREMLRNSIDYLSTWERRFLKNIAERMHLTDTQDARLAQIIQTVAFRRDHREEFHDV